MDADLERRFSEMQQRKAAALQELSDADAAQNAASFFEFAADRHADLLCVCAVDHAAQYTFAQLDAAANRIAHWALAAGVRQLDTVALLMENRPEFLAFTIGFAKVGATVALINTNLRGDLMRHALAVSGARLVVVSLARRPNWDSLPLDTALASEYTDVFWYAGQDTIVPLDSFPKSVEHSGHKISHRALGPELLDSFGADRPPTSARDRVGPRTPLFYIFTSGTTGPSKAAKFSHRRFIGAAVTWAAPSGLARGDRYYITLPLYHGNAGVVAVAPCYLLGNTIVLRERFSVSSFFKDIREFNCKATIYIGELWRYLYSLPTMPGEETPEVSPLRVAIGNGLRGDVWESVCRRFHLTQIVEHYGSTEMPGDAILNYFNRPGSCGYLPFALARQKSMTGEGGLLVRYDVENDAVVRDGDGRCVPCSPGETGEMIMRLPDGVYDGYVGDAATQRKLYRDVFETGDAWWSSGDLLRVDDLGFFYFVDRTGDSFRWKGENVSTQDVQTAVASFPDVVEVNVYGVRIPHTDGRAGMTSIVLSGDKNHFVPTDRFDFNAFTAHIAERLPSYARPIFVRLRDSEHDKTSTLKFQKYKYVQQGFEPSKTEGDPVFVFWPPTKSWRAVDAHVLSELEIPGKIKF